MLEEVEQPIVSLRVLAQQLQRPLLRSPYTPWWFWGSISTLESREAVYVSVCDRECIHVCVWERERVYTCVCVRERESVYMCVCERERERECKWGCYIVYKVLTIFYSKIDTRNNIKVYTTYIQHHKTVSFEYLYLKTVSLMKARYTITDTLFLVILKPLLLTTKLLWGDCYLLTEFECFQPLISHNLTLCNKIHNLLLVSNLCRNKIINKEKLHI